MATTPTPTGLLRTLAIEPGTREMGSVVLAGTELWHFGVPTFPHRLTDHQLLDEGQRFARALIETFDPHVFAIEPTRYARSTRSPRLHRLVTGLQRVAKRRGLLVVAYPPSRVKETIGGDAVAPRRHVAETLVRQGYPYLAKYLTTDRRSQERYWEQMFDALALGLTAYEEIAKAQVLRTFRVTSGP
jgi:Holliday junction resolvasome RuvABC endonuclease subunit